MSTNQVGAAPRGCPEHIVAAIIRRSNDVLLVRQQGLHDAQPVWALPAGVVEEGELLTEALAREVREETGLQMREPGELAYVAQLHKPSGPAWSQGEQPSPGGQATAFAFEVGELDGEIASPDSDAFVSQARFWSLRDAIDELGRLPWRFMREPVVAYLRGEVAPGALWLYRRRPDGYDDLVGRLPASGARSTDQRSDLATTDTREAEPATPESQSTPQHAIVLVGCMIVLVALGLLIVLGLIFLHK